ncbi:MAG: glutaminyl-peptide cyclotransferase [Pseudomonadota bacterium]
MRTITALVLLGLLLAAAPASPARAGDRAGAPVFSYRVVKAYPHDPDRFTQGLAVEGDTVYEGTGLYGKSRLLAWELASGRIIASRDLDPAQFGEGLTIFKDVLIQLTWKNGLGLVHDKKSLRLLRTFTYPGQGWGLTNDGRRLIMSDGTAELRFLDPIDFHELKRITVADNGVPVKDLNELEFVRGGIWANVWKTDRIAIIDPEDGRVTAWVDLAGLLAPFAAGSQGVLNGVAYDPENGRLLATGKLWPRIYEIELKTK